ncbi:MAG TPA: acyltransferase, partial [Terriglobales bacterium]|nr:acyltransferase [Terriglobales bacterium]
VLAHHAVLAYCTFVPKPPASLNSVPLLWTAFPVVDTVHFPLFDLLVGFNDSFFMALMFLLSGLFVWSSLTRKGSDKFLKDRALRLGLPFAVAAALIAPLAYYPSYLQTGASGFSGFWHQWRALGNWPAGPAWFVWVLLAFDCVAVGIFLLAPRFGQKLGDLLSGISQKPFLFFLTLAAISAAVYLPMELKFNAFYWLSFGPFFVQTSRILHYFVYFLVGIGLGAYGINRGLLAADGKLARRPWLVWAIVAMVAVILDMATALTAMQQPSSPRLWEAAAAVMFTISCAASSLFFISLFSKYMQRRRAIWDSLSANAYGMYLVHYAFASWLQYALLKTHLPAIAKGSLVFLGTLALSWAVTSALRRVHFVGRVI